MRDSLLGRQGGALCLDYGIDGRCSKRLGAQAAAIGRAAPPIRPPAAPLTRPVPTAAGFRGRAKNCVRIARERVEKSLQYAFRDRKAKKRDFRALWITRINAGARQYGVSER